MSTCGQIPALHKAPAAALRLKWRDNMTEAQILKCEIMTGVWTVGMAAADSGFLVWFFGALALMNLAILGYHLVLGETAR